jgi:hypothetical protein
MAAENQIPAELVSAFRRAIQACEFLKEGHTEQKAPYNGGEYTIGEIGDLCAAFGFADKMPDDVYQRLASLASPTLKSEYLHRDGGDTFGSGGALLRKMYDSLPKRR